MSLTPGTRIGSYEITAQIGAGGMGEVYRARDTRLNREVAVKVLPEAFAADAERLARFTREAQTLASLNHPNIAAIYGIEDRALVMELVDGRDLSEIIAAGPLAIDEALRIARQISEALETAHDLGIVHRDLKPANIKVREDGTVKVLDFGLAKAVDPGGLSNSIAANSPTLTAHATQMGMIIGTAAYMSPEQAKGKSVDRRADIWAFGVVLFETLTGTQAFAGDSITEILGAVVLKEPDWSKLPAATPPRLRELLQGCLQKDVRMRRRGMGDVTLELGAIAARASGITTSAIPEATRRTSRTVIAAGVVAALVLGTVAGRLLPRASSSSSSPARFIVSSPDDQRVSSSAISSDGQVMVFVADRRLYKRELGSYEATLIPGTEGARVPMVSPNGRSVAFFADGQLKKVSLAGGDPTTITQASGSMPGGAWGPDDTIVFSRGWATGLSVVSTDGGEVRQLTEPDRANGERGHWRPHPLGDGRRLIFTIMMAGSGVNDARIGLLNLETGTHRALFPGTDGVYLPSGHILYFHAGAWHVVPFDIGAEKTTGEPVTVLDDAVGVTPDGGDSGDRVAVAANGTLVYPPGPYYRTRELAWMDMTGQVESLGMPPRTLVGASLSPDGRQIAVSRVENGTYEIWMNGVERKTEDRLAIKGSNFGPVWHPRGELIAFTSTRLGQYDLYTARPDGSGEEALLTRDFDEQPVAWLRDGRLVEKEWRTDGSTPVLLLDPSAGQSPQMLLPQGGDVPFRVSPDDRWLLYSKAASGTSQVYVKSLATEGIATRVSAKAGEDAVWSPDGRDIYFRHDQNLVAVTFRAIDGRVEIGPERVLFPLPESTALYGLSPDGKRFLVGRPADPDPVPGLRVTLNWFDELTISGAGR